MKIYNLILLNFCLIQLFPLLFGMHPGDGPGSYSGWPSGSQSGWLNFGGDSGSHPGGMNQGEGSASQSGWINFEGGSGSQGINQGAGPSGSGSQQPMNLDEEIHKLLQVNGNSRPHPEIIPRQLRNKEEPIQVIDTVAKQYENLLSAYNELNNEFENCSTRVKNIPVVRLHYLVITILFIYKLFLLGDDKRREKLEYRLRDYENMMMMIKSLISF